MTGTLTHWLTTKSNLIYVIKGEMHEFYVHSKCHFTNNGEYTDDVMVMLSAFIHCKCIHNYHS